MITHACRRGRHETSLDNSQPGLMQSLVRVRTDRSDLEPTVTTRSMRRWIHWQAQFLSITDQSTKQLSFKTSNSYSLGNCHQMDKLDLTEAIRIDTGVPFPHPRSDDQQQEPSSDTRGKTIVAEICSEFTDYRAQVEYFKKNGLIRLVHDKDALPIVFSLSEDSVSHVLPNSLQKQVDHSIGSMRPEAWNSRR
jgi:hypothetical protein